MSSASTKGPPRLPTQAEGAVMYNPYAYEVHEDPYPVYARLREEAPLYHNEELGFWALSRHADVFAGFRNTDDLSNRRGVSLDATMTENAENTMSFLAMDPPRHTRMRALVSRVFTPRRVAALEPGIRELARHYIERFDGPRCEFISDFAGRLPMDVVSQMLGVPEADRETLRKWADLVVHREEGSRDIPTAGLEAALEIVGYFEQSLADRRDKPGDDLTGALLTAEIDGDSLSEREIIGFLFLMIIAGNETTTKLLANALYWAWRNPDQFELVRNDPSLVPAWVEETLRYDPSSQALARTSSRELEWYGQTVPADSMVVLLVGAANRDPRVFDHADVYDIRRDTTDTMAFGHGTHFCLGASLARLEARVALEELLGSFAGYELDPDGLERVHSVNVRGFSAMPVEFKK